MDYLDYIAENTASEILVDVKSRHTKYEMLETQLLELESAMNSVSASKMSADRVSTSRTQNGLDEQVIKLFSLQAQVAGKMIENLNLNAFLYELLCEMDNDDYIKILHYRYFKLDDEGKRRKWEEIAKHVNFSEEHTKRLHALAVEAFQNTIYKRLNQSLNIMENAL